MSFTHTTLKQALQDWTENSETTFVNNLDVFIKNAEERFYKAALPRLLAMDGNEDLARVFAERGILKNMGIVK